MHPNSVSMSTRFAGLVLLACLGPWAVASAAQPFPKGDAAKGQVLHQQKCASCHNSMMPDGKGNRVRQGKTEEGKPGNANQTQANQTKEP